MNDKIRILLAEDHESVRQGLCALFSGAAEFEVVADVKDGAAAVSRARDTSPDVVVMDLSMPTPGLVAMREIMNARPETAVVVLTRHRDSAYVRAAFDAGAQGYVLKQSPFSELTKAVSVAARGERYLDQRLTGDPALAHTVLESGTSPLSHRETEVLRRAASGHANKDIAAELRISVKTVEAHKANAMRKLRITDRSGLVRYAVMQGWLQDE